MEEDNKKLERRHLELARFCSVLSTSSRIALIEKIASDGDSIKDDFVELEGMSKFTVGINLRYLKKFDLINGNITSKKLSYGINFKKLDELKELFDEFYDVINSNRGSNNNHTFEK